MVADQRRCGKTIQMTAIDVIFRYEGELQPAQIRQLSGSYSIYGVRRIAVDEQASTITVEYDATRLSNDAVAALLRRCGINPVERVDTTLPVGPPAEAEAAAKA